MGCVGPWSARGAWYDRGMELAGRAADVMAVLLACGDDGAATMTDGTAASMTGDTGVGVTSSGPTMSEVTGASSDGGSPGTNHVRIAGNLLTELGGDEWGGEDPGIDAGMLARALAGDG